MTKFNVEHLSLNPQIRNCEIQGVKYFSVIDVLAVLRKTDFRTAQNHYHVIKNRMRKNEVAIPDLKQIKAKTANEKYYLTDFTTQFGISTLVDYVTPNLRRESHRIDIRHDDERINFHPQVIAFFEARGWQVQHHVMLPLGSQIDVVATLTEENIQSTFIVECKPHLSRQHFYTAIGQSLCYRAEYGEAAISVIATYSSELDAYVELCCQNIGVRLLAVDMLEHTTIRCDNAFGYDLVTEKPLLPKKSPK